MNQITVVTTFEYDHKDRVTKETVVSTEVEIEDIVQPGGTGLPLPPPWNLNS